MRTVLITGGAGFIGSAFIRYLFEHDPHIKLIVLDALTYAGNLDNLPSLVRESSRLEFWQANVNDFDLVNDLTQRADCVVHFAAETHVARSLYCNRVFFETDVLGTQSVANAVLRWSDRVERFIHISSSEVYGTAAYEPMDEGHPLNPATPYAAAKAGADRLVYSYMVTYDLPAVILRPFNNYGPYQHLEKAVPRLITSVLLDEPFTIHGSGDAARDWIHVDDTARAVARALEAPLKVVRGQVLNIGTGRSISISEIASMVASMMSKPNHPVEYVEDRLGQVVKHIAATEKARKVLGFEPGICFEQGLEKTIRWYSEHTDWWKSQLSLRRVPVKLRNGKVIHY